MNTVFYIIIFIVGIILGSLYATIIERMSKGKRAFSIHSYCAKCGKKLSALEKIPIFSYILLKGKCKHCKHPIKSKYIILEVITGFLLMFIAYSLNISFLNVSITNLVSFIFIILYFTYIILNAGLDFEKSKMSSILLSYGIIISIAYLSYLCFVQSTTIYASIVYLVVIILLLLLNIVNTKKRAQDNYVIDLLTMLLVMLIFTGEVTCILMISATLVSIALYILVNKIKQSKSKIKKATKMYNSNIKIVFIMGTLNIFMFSVLLSLNN